MADESDDSDESLTLLGEAWGKLIQVFSRFRSRPSEPAPFIGSVSSMDGDSLVSGKAFVPESSYFSIRLVDMHLAQGGMYFKSFLPMGVCVAEYAYGLERRRLPLILSNEIVQKMIGNTKGTVGPVSFSDIPVVSRAPVKEDNVALFVGLFRMPYSDFAESVLQLAADVSQEVGAAALASEAKIARKLYDRVSELFGLNQVVARFAYLDGMALRKSGYILVSGPLPKGVNPKDFIVKNSRLALQAGASTKPDDLDGIDYCLISMEQHGNRFSEGVQLRQLTALPFHARWQEVTKLLSARKIEDADAAFLALRGEVAVSPDLTEDDRLLAVAGYDAGYTKWSQVLLAKPGGAATRAARSDTPAVSLSAVAQISDTGTATALNAIIKYLGERSTPNLADTSASLDKQANGFLVEAFSTLGTPLASARKQGATAAVLANALAIGTSRLP